MAIYARDAVPWVRTQQAPHRTGAIAVVAIAMTSTPNRFTNVSKASGKVPTTHRKMGEGQPSAGQGKAATAKGGPVVTTGGGQPPAIRTGSIWENIPQLSASQFLSSTVEVPGQREILRRGETQDDQTLIDARGRELLTGWALDGLTLTKGEF